MTGKRAAASLIRNSLLVAVATLAGAAHAGVVWSSNGHEYGLVFAQDITWTAARAAATGLGAGWDLVTLTSAEEDAFVRTLLPASPIARTHLWIGANDAVTEGDWKWVTSEAWSYTGWWNDEPNDNGGIEEYVALDFRQGTWAWNDVSNNIDGRGWARGYLIERAPEAIPLPATLLLSAIGLALMPWSRRRAARERRRVDGDHTSLREIECHAMT